MGFQYRHVYSVARDHARENMMNMDRRAHTLGNALEEARTMLEQADRARRWVFLNERKKYTYRRKSGGLSCRPLYTVPTSFSKSSSNVCFRPLARQYT
jgi:hypothetical protein